MDAVWIGIAFLLGLLARQLSLPPLVGYLAAGFAMYALDINPGRILDQFASIGITLLLFSIGLNLRASSLLMPRIWGTASIHMLISTAGMALVLWALGTTTLSLVSGLTWPIALLLGFALSYSSTVFAVKVLEDRGEPNSTYGRVSIGILIMQDIAAVLFLAASAGKLPPPQAILLIAALWPMRWLLLRIMDRTGHEELLILFGLTVALGGAQLFSHFGIKGDMGALVFGLLLSQHRWSTRLSAALLSFKDLFLVGFFLSIGLHGIPGADAILVAVLLLALVPLKSVLYFWLLVRFNLRARTSFLSATTLGNYSEFGLIVAAIAAGNGWLSADWLTTIAVALSLSFIAAAPVTSAAHRLYDRYRGHLVRFQRPNRVAGEEEIDSGDATVLIFGMGRVGTGAYEEMHQHRGEHVVGIDMVPEVIDAHRAAGRHVIRASATDPEFWSRLRLHSKRLKLVMLAMPQCEENVFAARQLIKYGYRGRIAALAKFEEDVQLLKDTGVHSVFNLYAEAGAGFAEDAYRGSEPVEVPEASA